LNLLQPAGVQGVGSSAGLHPLLLVALACGLDRLVGDPRWCPHPVVLMGWWIRRLRGVAERWAGDRAGRLRRAGLLITLLLVAGSALAGWAVEWLARSAMAQGGWPAWCGAALLVIALASALAGRSLSLAVQRVLAVLPGDGSAAVPQFPEASLAEARHRLSWIVGRDTDGLDRQEILRALAETASENGVDGLFAPLFWMLLGAGLWAWGDPGCTGGALAWPGPLALAWAFKAASTLDSMLGYRCGRLRWLGTAGARLDDLLVWLPCRLTAATLALVACRPWQAAALLQAALRDGRPDPSPNAGVSQAAYAHGVGVQLGGANRYGGEWRAKPLLAKGSPPPDAAAVRRMLALSGRLSWLWLGLAGLPDMVRFITKTLS
jgi:adenosylcobinamide-phosphate synthase